MSDSHAALSSYLKSFFAQKQLEARRIFHGRGQCYPGLEYLCIDWYPPVVLVSLFEEKGKVDELLQLLGASDELGQIGSVIVQKRYERNAPAEVVLGPEVEQLVVQENGLLYEVHPGRRQNAGLFMDMRLVRDWLSKNSSGRNVLNLFAYTCSLSVAALAGGATHVTSVDISKTSIAWGKRNHELNGQPLERIKCIPYNLFTSWGRIKQYGRYDLVIIDPPTRQRGSFEAEKDYGSVVKRLGSFCNPGAEVLACLNSPFLDTQWLLDLFAQHAPAASLVEKLAVAPDYPDREPERGLKICRFRMGEISSLDE